MNLTKTTSLLGIATAATAAIAGAPMAGAQQPASAAKVTGAYLFIQKLPTAGTAREPTLTPYATLVFKTDHQLPRRFDGLIRAGAGVAGQNGSVGAVHGKASRCYQVFARIKKDNTITGTAADGKVKQTTARVGSRLAVTITTAKGAATVHRMLTLQEAKRGDVSGKPLGC